MKNMITVLIQPRWSEWSQNFAIRTARKAFREFVSKTQNERWASGKRNLNYTRLLDDEEVRGWVSDRYIELRGAYRIRISYAEFEPLVASYQVDLPDEWVVRSRYGNPHGHSFRHGHGYVQSPDHGPKDSPTEDPWHTEKRHKRDKAKAGGGCMRHGCRGRRFWVKQAAKDHRAWVKRQIYKEDWDAFGRGTDDSEYIIEPWDWD